MTTYHKQDFNKPNGILCGRPSKIPSIAVTRSMVNCQKCYKLMKEQEDEAFAVKLADETTYHCDCGGNFIMNDNENYICDNCGEIY